LTILLSDNLKAWQPRHPLQPESRSGRVGQRRQVVIPREICETLELRVRDFVAFAKQHNGVLIQPKRVVDPDDVLTPAEAKKIRHGMKSIKEGRDFDLGQGPHL
jgi:bifunctional DNA-binding transcriptional regulator/antitoxin component of YhaV-PrlF toxin-antitoxin module